MSKRPQRIRGTQDIFGEEADRFQKVVETFDRVRRLYAFQRVEIPVFEATEVFARSIGETTDVVSKEMYTFEDRGGDSLTLRPEFTAGIARAYLTEGWQQYAPLKLATHGPVFRYERPQKGRFRQFHQLDAEIIGTDRAAADVELLVLADQLLLHELGIADGITLQLNTLGDAATRDAWRQALVAHFESHRGDLSEDSLVRLDKNPMRILDSKDPRDRPAADSAPSIDDFPHRRGGRFLRPGHRRPRRRRRRLDPQPAPGPRPRLLPPHRLRIRHRSPRRPRHRSRGRTLRWADGEPWRATDASRRLGGGHRAPGDAD